MYIQSKTGCFAAGTVGKDAEMSHVGDKQTSKLTFSIAVGKEADGSTKWLNCEAWSKMADYCAGIDIQKGDPVSAWGYIKINEYKEKTYVNLVVEGIASFSGRAYQQNSTIDISGFTTEIEDVDDDDLPF